MRLLTVGHGTAEREQFSALLHGAGVEVLADVRRFPGSRRNLDTRKEALEEWLPSHAIDYVWFEDLGVFAALGGAVSMAAAVLPGTAESRGGRSPWVAGAG